MTPGVSVRLDCKSVKSASSVRVSWVSDVAPTPLVNISVISHSDSELPVINIREREREIQLLLNCCSVTTSLSLRENSLMTVFYVCLFVPGLSMLLVNAEH